MCTMNPKPCFSGWNFPIVILHGTSTTEVNWFDPKLLFEISRKLTILELSRFSLFTISLAQLLTTLKTNFDIQLWILCTLISGFFPGKVTKKKKKKKKTPEKIYHSHQEGPWNSNLVVRLNEHVLLLPSIKNANTLFHLRNHSTFH